MAYLNFISFVSRARTYRMYHAKFTLKNTIFPSYLKRTSRTFVNSSKMFKPDEPVSFLSKSFSASFNKNLITYCVRYPARINEHFRYFRTSERRCLHPVFWAILRPAMKFMAVLTGRAFRKWWRDLPPNKKKYFLQSVKENRKKLSIFAITCIGLSGIYYVSHLEETPISKRRRFIAFSSKQLEKMSQFELQQLKKHAEKDFLPATHPSYQRVRRIVDRIVKANWHIKEIREKNWDVGVINTSIENAFVLPIGFVCVFAGMLALCATDDELGFILSHEIAHCIEGHGVEKASVVHLFDLISIVIIAAIWALIPSDSLSLFSHWLYSKFVRIFLELPYERKMETEADSVGLKLAAKACFDVRESSAFWTKMAVVQRASNQGPEIDFLSTHPSHEKRSEYLDSLMDEAIKYRYECGCPKLKPIDPRLNIEIVARALEVARQKYLHQFPKPTSPFYTNF